MHWSPAAFVTSIIIQITPTWLYESNDCVDRDDTLFDQTCTKVIETLRNIIITTRRVR